MDDAAPLNRQTLENLRSLQRPGRPSLLERIAKLYETESADIISRLRQALDHGQAEDLRQAAHRFKSVSGNIGADTLSALCREMELMGGEARLDGAEEKLRQLEIEHERVAQSLVDEVARKPTI